MEFAINAVTTLQSFERARIENSPASKQQDVLAVRAEHNAPVKPKLDVRSLERAASRLNQALQAFDRDLAISIHDDGKVVVRVTDPKTGDVIRQIPPERVLEVEENLGKIVGLFVNDKA